MTQNVESAPPWDWMDPGQEPSVTQLDLGCMTLVT